MSSQRMFHTSDERRFERGNKNLISQYVHRKYATETPSEAAKRRFRTPPYYLIAAEKEKAKKIICDDCELSGMCQNERVCRTLFETTDNVKCSNRIRKEDQNGKTV